MSETGERKTSRRYPKIAALWAFHQAVKHGGMAAGARAMGVSLPTMSEHIATLEARYERILFRKVRGRTAELTEAGRELAEKIAPVMEKLEEVLS